MPPRRVNSNNSNNTDLAALLTQLVNQITQANNNNNGHASGSAATGGGGGANPPQCTFKHFNSCNPLKFYGSKGATGLLQWFESIESTFLNSDCPDNLRTRHATSVFQKRALTWWNGEKRTRGVDVAMALPWDELKRIMTEEFCPRNEMKKLEAEFWDLAQDSGESLAYTTRFHELSLLVPHMVTPLSRCIEKYIGGLPRQIQDTVIGGNPATLEDAIRLSATLTDNHVKAGTLTRKGAKKVSETTTPPAHVKEVQTEPYRNTRKRKVKNCAVITPAAPVNQVTPIAPNPAKKPYGGSYPLCNTCNYHHPPNIPCRLCNHCGKHGHTANICRAKALANQTNPANQANHQATNQAIPAIANGRACFECGDPNHFRNQCPRLINVNQGGARGRAFNINANEAQANTDVVNGTFLMNNHYASILFDTGADKSFVSLDFEPLLAKTRSKLEKTFTVEVADGNTVTIDTIIYDCSLELNKHTFPINLIPMPLGSFDIIVGMDWLSKHHAEVMCFDKCKFNPFNHILHQAPQRQRVKKDQHTSVVSPVQPKKTKQKLSAATKSAADKLKSSAAKSAADKAKTSAARVLKSSAAKSAADKAKISAARVPTADKAKSKAKPTVAKNADTSTKLSAAGSTVNKQETSVAKFAADSVSKTRKTPIRQWKAKSSSSTVIGSIDCKHTEKDKPTTIFFKSADYWVPSTN
ncbi:hypothetical protein L1987_08815 [Smallanthus sonchifolius]|uniref:Uncharacterized protein n=1 Tax=Smallanthus sonchifolius TaxID=185202 RepID=A0ACB9JM84_9ASTR|nr:hypothetical protein L1987_08815 [Smallanthus sonchifolius]